MYVKAIIAVVAAIVIMQVFAGSSLSKGASKPVAERAAAMEVVDK
jgi:hypothetical protein